MKATIRGLMVLWLALASFSVTSAAVIIAGDHPLLPDHPDLQPVRINVKGGDAVEALNFRIRIGNGVAPSPSPAPTIPDDNGVDLLGTAADPTIFYFNHTKPRDLDDPDTSDYYEAWAVSTSSGTVSAGTPSTEELLAIVQIDTRGVDSGQWDLILRDPGDRPTDFATPDPPELRSGTIRILGGPPPIIPEPATLAVWSLLAGLAVGFGWRRKHTC